MSGEKKRKPASVEEDLRDIREEDLLRKKGTNPRTKKIILLLVGIFAVLLMFSFIYIEFPVFNILFGQLESRPLQENTISAGNITVVFSTDALNSIRSYYDRNQKTEISLCLSGSTDGRTYFIDGVYKPITLSQSFSRVVHEPCNASTLIDFHTHPYKSCVASDVDLENLARTKLNNPEAVMLIMCEPARFSVYG
jgi:hypothetical protein